MLASRQATLDSNFFIPESANQGVCQRSPGALLNIKSGELIRASCKQWICKHCGPRRAKHLYRRLAPVPWTRFVTLTMPPLRGNASLDNCRAQSHGWRMFRQFLRRKAGGGEYAWVRELSSANGRLHLHALIRSSWFSYRQARRCISAAGLGVVCDFRKIKRGGRVSGYVTKYVTKDVPGRIGWPMSVRRFGTSIKDKKPANSEWVFFRKAAPPTPLSGLHVLKNDARRQYAQWGDGLRVPCTESREDGELRLWIELGRPVASVPGPFRDGLHQLCLALIKKEQLHHDVAETKPP